MGFGLSKVFSGVSNSLGLGSMGSGLLGYAAGGLTLGPLGAVFGGMAAYDASKKSQKEESDKQQDFQVNRESQAAHQKLLAEINQQQPAPPPSQMVT